ncbi:hypothetical protein RP20_CCG014889 [Aedes albopictus]|nr:hypothetical protein RP20_CCG014889 [Aedes albopictus]
MGFRDIPVIDMDTIKLSNPNQQCLFRLADSRQLKADSMVYRHADICTIQVIDASIYRQFYIIVRKLVSGSMECSFRCWSMTRANQKAR